jgi:hypothetical protein
MANLLAERQNTFWHDYRAIVLYQQQRQMEPELQSSLLGTVFFPLEQNDRGNHILMWC